MLIAVPVKSEKASEIGPTPAYKNIKTLIKAIGKPNEKRLREGADLVIYQWNTVLIIIHLQLVSL
jgi:hypothetical protein